MNYEVVSHVWNYSKICCYHLSAWLLHPPTIANITVTIFYARTDLETAAVLDFFRSQQWPSNVGWRFWPLDEGELMRRAFGRNLAAKATIADFVHFSDIDYIYGPGCADSIVEALPSITGPLAYPRYVTRCESDESGDALIQKVTIPAIYDLSYIGPTERNRKAVGGCQIVRGDVARKVGYLPWHPKHQSPAKRWVRTFDDKVFRHELGTAGEPIEAVNMYRMRHSQKGRTVEGCRN